MLETIVDIVGAEHVSQDTASFTALGVTPQVVVSPASEGEVSEILLLAQELQWAVIPWGYGRQQHIGLPPRRGEIALSLRRMHRILEYEPADLTITVQAGVPLADLQTRLRASGQWLPYDPPYGAGSSLGGLIATNISGPHRYRYGTLRDLIIRTRMVQGDGMAFTGGAKVVKNVSGYDLPRLITGSFGTLGVITEATFKLQPLLKSSRTLLFGFRSFQMAAEQAAAFLGTALIPVAVAVYNGN
ncbi:MAG: FAD-binding oxidoreductase, partial [Chloroflexi bacterium]|nr:FAD-binding oxidoreductase [Chloroflexota bacterium]